jgi:hypothetical protein
MLAEIEWGDISRRGPGRVSSWLFLSSIIFWLSLGVQFHRISAFVEALTIRTHPFAHPFTDSKTGVFGFSKPTYMRTPGQGGSLLITFPEVEN